MSDVLSKKAIKAGISEMLAAGEKKTEVFRQFQGRGIGDAQVAYLIAIHPDPVRCNEHGGKVKVLIGCMLVLALGVFFFGAANTKMDVEGQGVAAAISALLFLLLALGFYRHRAWAYQTYITLALLGIPQQFKDYLAGFANGEIISTSIIIAITMGLLIFIIYVQNLIFPDLLLFWPRNVKGQYVFKD